MKIQIRLIDIVIIAALLLLVYWQLQPAGIDPMPVIYTNPVQAAPAGIVPSISPNIDAAGTAWAQQVQATFAAAGQPVAPAPSMTPGPSLNQIINNAPNVNPFVGDIQLP
jgi:hypothetical protein